MQLQFTARQNLYIVKDADIKEKDLKIIKYKPARDRDRDRDRHKER